MHVNLYLYILVYADDYMASSHVVYTAKSLRVLTIFEKQKKELQRTGLLPEDGFQVPSSTGQGVTVFTRLFLLSGYSPSSNLSVKTQTASLFGLSAMVKTVIHRQ